MGRPQKGEMRMLLCSSILCPLLTHSKPFFEIYFEGCSVYSYSVKP
jgi:hypothetical protein